MKKALVMDWDPVTHYKGVAVAERYDRERFSSLAGRTFNALEKHNIRKAFRQVPRDQTVLDLPCGTGRFAEVLLEQGFKVVGVDISAPMLEVARRKLKRFGTQFDTLVADAHELSRYEKKRYDVALCARVLMHFPLEEQISFLRSVAELTKGRVVFSQSLSTPYQRFRRRVKQLIGNQPPAMYPITEAELSSLLNGVGLKEVGRLRPAPLVTEAIYVIAEPA
jgi:2-polyprenyl-3-methyl-5-hydroxy-6-metoxy-1,4-benzoquinol methylase